MLLLNLMGEKPGVEPTGKQLPLPTNPVLIVKKGENSPPIEDASDFQPSIPPPIEQEPNSQSSFIQNDPQE